MKKFKSEELADFILQYLEENDSFNALDPKEKIKVFKLYNEVLEAFYKSILYPNVLPIVSVYDFKTATIMASVLDKVGTIIPAIDKIKVRLIN